MGERRKRRDDGIYDKKTFPGGGMMEKKSIRRKKWYIFLIILFLLVGVTAGICIYFYPRWRAAGNLQGSLAAARFTYDLDIVLDKGALETQQVEMMENLSKLTGFGEDALFRFSVKGGVCGDRIYALFYPDGAADPLIELYLSSDIDVINETLPYNTIRKNLTAQHKLLDRIMPAERDAVYMTLDQIEELFEVDLSGLRDFALPMERTALSRLKCFLLLLAMSEENGAYSAANPEAVGGKAMVKLVPSKAGAGPVTLSFDVQRPGELLVGSDGVISLPEEFSVQEMIPQLKLLESVSGKLVLGEGEEIRLPNKFMGQEKMDVLIGIRDLIRKVVELFTPSSSGAAPAL